jgi:hypothetical protein
VRRDKYLDDFLSRLPISERHLYGAGLLDELKRRLENINIYVANVDAARKRGMALTPERRQTYGKAKVECFDLLAVLNEMVHARDWRKNILSFLMSPSAPQDEALPRRRGGGRKPKLINAIMEEMQSQIASGVVTLEELSKLKEEALVLDYSKALGRSRLLNRETVRKARERLFGNSKR